MEITALNFREVWGQQLRSVEFTPTPLLPEEANAFFRSAGLPAQFSFGKVCLRFLARSPRLSQTWAKTMDSALAMPHDWHRYWQIGEVQSPQSKAWICIEELTGKIAAIDLKSDDHVKTVNSSVLLLATCMKTMVDWHGETRGDVGQVADLLKELTMHVDRSDAKHYWIPMIEREVEGEAMRLAVVVS